MHWTPAFSQTFRRATRHPNLLALALYSIFFLLFFGPVIFSGKLLAPGDGYIYYFAHFQSPLKIWDSLAATGFPAAADPQVMTFYPLRVFFSSVLHNFNLFVVSAYVLASWFTFVFVRMLTGSSYSGVLAGFVYGLSGFMTAHLGHTTIIHAAAWLPALLIVVERLRPAVSLRWIGLGALAAANCVLAGHPQIALYGFAFAGVFTVYRAVSGTERLRYLAAVAACFLLGAALCAVQVLPARELSRITPRAMMSFDYFTQFSLELYQLALFIFPGVFGGSIQEYLQGVPYFGSVSLTETAAYVGFISLVLALAALACRRPAWPARFFAISAAFAVAAAMGGATPIGHVLYHVPGFGQFRVPGRLLIVFCISLAVLTGLGASTVTKRRDLARRFAWIAIGGAVALLFAGGVIWIRYGKSLRWMAAKAGFPDIAVEPWRNLSLAVPLVLGLVGVSAFLLFVRNPLSWLRRTILAVALMAELVSFAGWLQWLTSAPVAVAEEPPATKRHRGVLLGGGRWLSVRGYQASPSEIAPDLFELWRVPSVSKYGPLLPSRYTDLVGVQTYGAILGDWSDTRNRAIDLVGARVIGTGDTAARPENGLLFAGSELNTLLGEGCAATKDITMYSLRPPLRATGIGLVTTMACSTGLQQGAAVAELRFGHPDGSSTIRVLRAGIDTAEWAAGCLDVAPLLRHRQATVYSTFSVARGDHRCEGRTYRTVVHLDRPQSVSMIQFRWTGGPGAIRIVHAAVWDETAGLSYPLTEGARHFADPQRWRFLGEEGSAEFYENLQAMPRVWLASETVSLAANDVRRTIQTSRLPDDREYDPARQALIEEPLGFKMTPDDQAGAWLVSDEGTRVIIQAWSHQPAFLVLGDLYYPGWLASINGQPTRIFQTNYIQRGVLVPGGSSTVVFEYRPASLYAGAAISLGGFVVVLGCWFVPAYRRRTRIAT